MIPVNGHNNKASNGHRGTNVLQDVDKPRGGGGGVLNKV